MTPEDFPELVRLFRDLFGDPMDVGEWSWKYAARPGTMRSFVTVRDGRIVRHVGLRRHELTLDGRPCEALDIVDGMSLPSERASQVPDIARRGREHIQRAQDADPGTLFTFGFTNPGLAGQRVRDGLYLLQAPVGECHLDRLDPPAAIPRGVAVVSSPPEAWDERWHELESDMTLVRRRDSAYLRWRYSEHPRLRYTYVSTGEGGLAVVRTGGPAAYLMELLAAPGDSATLGRLALAAEWVAARAGATSLVAFFPRWSEHVRVLTGACRFHAVEPVERLIVSTADRRLAPETITDGFFYSLGDWDAR
ncbi:MAG: hypothetical protein QOE06_3642 [Thermoleophilaceae bacterium]|nr:hypothetical protein [Thermoleophilaceae bacterium]